MVDPQSRPSLGMTTDPADLETRTALIEKAIEMNEARHAALWAIDKIQAYDQHDLAYFFDVLNGDGEASTAVTIADTGTDECQPLCESIKSAKRLSAQGQGGTEKFTRPQLELVIDHLIAMMAQSHFRALPVTEQAELQQDDAFDPTEHYAKQLDGIWSVYYDVFMSKRLYGANLKSIDAVKKLVHQIVKRDRLPPCNPLEAQQALRDAWNIVDVCVHNANTYKRLSKASFWLSLLLGVLIVALTVFTDHNCNMDYQRLLLATNVTCTTDLCDQLLNCKTADSAFASSTAFFLTASLLVMVTGVNTYYDPSRRWQELRAAAENLHSDVFQFRTRTRVYAVDIAEPRIAENRFIQIIG